MTLIYKPKHKYIILDVIILILSVYVMLRWFPLTTHYPFVKYSGAALFYGLTWILISYMAGRYYNIKSRGYFDTLFQILYVTLLVYGLSWLLAILIYPDKYSLNVLFVYTLGFYVLENIFYSLIYAWFYAIEYEEQEPLDKIRDNAKVKVLPDLDDKSFSDINTSISLYSGERLKNYLTKNINLRKGNNKILFSTNFFDLKSIPDYQFDTFVHLERLNDVRGINTLFSIINEKLPDNGIFICCFESKSACKKKIYDAYPPIIAHCSYLLCYVFKRVIPKILLLRRLYFDITKGKNRVLSKTEVLGRLYYCGFEVKKEVKVDGLCYIFTQRVKQPESVKMRTYGPFIKLNRMGKNGKLFEVYKMRTMYPYSEYLQKYIFEKNDLKEGGKFKRDIRINTLGKLMRKYWIDELPMIYNLLRREMKIVGVRPLSSHYYSLYTRELQEKRIKFKPGLLPPFYADMPKTLEEIEASELKYLNECETIGVHKTDFKYFLLILKNIILKKARSA